MLLPVRLILETFAANDNALERLVFARTIISRRGSAVGAGRIGQRQVEIRHMQSGWPPLRLPWQNLCFFRVAWVRSKKSEWDFEQFGHSPCNENRVLQHGAPQSVRSRGTCRTGNVCCNIGSSGCTAR